MLIMLDDKPEDVREDVGEDGENNNDQDQHRDQAGEHSSNVLMIMKIFLMMMMWMIPG